jgi:Flp pilus assembly protein TadB
VKGLADFLMTYGWVGVSAILMLVVAFLYRKLGAKEKKIYELYEKNETNAIKFVESMEKMRQLVEKLVERGTTTRGGG